LCGFDEEQTNNKNKVKCENVVRELFLIRIVLILLYAVFKSENMY